MPILGLERERHCGEGFAASASRFNFEMALTLLVSVLSGE